MSTENTDDQGATVTGAFSSNTAAAERPHHVLLDLDSAGYGTAILDGHPVQDSLLGVEVRAMAGEVTQVALHVRPGHAVAYKGDALVTVVQHAEGADPAAIAGWLSQVDPARLEQAALNRPDLSPSRHGLTQAILTTLAEWASGKG